MYHVFEYKHKNENIITRDSLLSIAVEHSSWVFSLNKYQGNIQLQSLSPPSSTNVVIIFSTASSKYKGKNFFWFKKSVWIKIRTFPQNSKQKQDYNKYSKNKEEGSDLSSPPTTHSTSSNYATISESKQKSTTPAQFSSQNLVAMKISLCDLLSSKLVGLGRSQLIQIAQEKRINSSKKISIVLLLLLRYKKIIITELFLFLFASRISLFNKYGRMETLRWGFWETGKAVVRTSSAS